MEARPPNLPPIPNIEPTGPLYFGFSEPPPRPPFMASTVPGGVQNTGQNHDRSNDTDPLPPAPPNPVAAQLPQQHDGTSAEHAGQQAHTGNQRRSEDSGEGTSSDREESEEEDERQAYYNRWRPIEEDKSEPCQDELEWIQRRSGGEQSALDHKHWESETFFEITDPDIEPGESGRIDWLVEHFNGTAENPNKEHVMKSDIVRVGGYDWRIKFYPKGNNSEYLSVYIECVTMQAAEFEEFEDFKQPPLPFVTGHEKVRKRRTVAVQLSIVMYNPSEPRVYECQMDAHQFTKQSSDYGWTRFTRNSRRDFFYREHGQRQSILRDDKLAFKAYIRVVNDPTNCLWSHGTQPYEDSLSLTGLRSFSTLTPSFSAMLPLLHFAPFRSFIYSCKDSDAAFWFQGLLWKMMARKRTHYYGRADRGVPSDAIAWLYYYATRLELQTDASIVSQIMNIEVSKGAAVASNRLKTKHVTSVQAAINAHPSALPTSALLTLELQRHEYDRKDRKWKKLNNKVEMQNKIIVSGTQYQLFSFSTHTGDLMSNKFNVYVRPNAENKLWYKYSNGNVVCLTQRQAVDKHCGFDDRDRSQKRKRSSSQLDPSLRGFRGFEDPNEVAHVVIYVRADLARPVPIEEDWDVPLNVVEGRPPKDTRELPDPPPTATDYEIAQMPPETEDDRARKKSFDEAAGYSTPMAWPMDGEDVIMSDAEDDVMGSSVEDLAASKAEVEHYVHTNTIDHLGREYYSGKMYRQHYHGKGHLIAMNGDEYTGDFRDGLKHGFGKMIYADTGNIYEGEWAHGEHHGQGKLIEAATGNVFEGGWKNGKKHGQFVLKGTVTDEDKGCCSICYDKEINTAFGDCGHVITCKECASMVEDCPVCRRRVSSRLQLYGVKLIHD